MLKNQPSRAMVESFPPSASTRCIDMGLSACADAHMYVKEEALYAPFWLLGTLKVACAGHLWSIDSQSCVQKLSRFPLRIQAICADVGRIARPDGDHYYQFDRKEAHGNHDWELSYHSDDPHDEEQEQQNCSHDQQGAWDTI